MNEPPGVASASPARAAASPSNIHPGDRAAEFGGDEAGKIGRRMPENVLVSERRDGHGRIGNDVDEVNQ